MRKIQCPQPVNIPSFIKLRLVNPNLKRFQPTPPPSRVESEQNGDGLFFVKKTPKKKEKKTLQI